MRKLIIILAVSTLFFSCEKSTIRSGDIGGGSGQGGSLARFTIVNNHLYAIDAQNLVAYDISTASDPIYKSTTPIGFNIEAMFPFEDKLFIASNDAMYIFSLNDPEAPTFESQVQHFTGCDPVVANDSLAFLTVHAGTACNGTVNALNVYDITDLTDPIQLSQQTLTEPWGLGLKGPILYVCDAGEGIRVYDAANPSTQGLTELTVVNEPNARDVIVKGNLLIVMLTNGTAYYDIMYAPNPQKLGEIVQ